MEVGAVLTLALAALIATGPTASGRPAVSGTLAQGARLAATAGTWAGSGTLAYAYQWYRCDANGAHCHSVRGATKSTYMLVAKDVGSTIGLTVRATDRSGTTSAYAPLAGVIARSAGATGQPVLGGEPIVGRELAAAGPAIWKRCNANGRACSAIDGATGATYTLVPADAGHAVVAVAGDVWSIATGAVRSSPGPVAIRGPGVSGVLQQGKQLRGGGGAWSGAGAVSYAYQWYRCDATGARCSSIHGATRSTYTLVAKDAGSTIGLTVRATDSTGTTAAYAPLAGVVAAAGSALFATAQPTIAGTTQLTIVAGTWSGAPTALAYRWLRCNANGRLCAGIPGATTDTYTPVAADGGHTVVVAVTATAGTVRQTVLTVAASV